VRIRTEDKGTKVWGRIINIQQHVEAVDVTLGPEAAKLGLRPDVARRHVPGRSTLQLIIEVEL
jgi:hypothetical protein